MITIGRLPIYILFVLEHCVVNFRQSAVNVIGLLFQVPLWLVS